MLPEEQDPFADYAPEPRTTGSPLHQTPSPTETGTAKYGTSKPRRVIVRGIVAENRDPDDKGE